MVIEWLEFPNVKPDKPCLCLVYCPDYTNYKEPIICNYQLTKEGLKFWDFDPLNDNDITEWVTHYCIIENTPYSE